MVSADMGRRERKRRDTVDQIAEIAWLLFEQYGFGNVTMEAIATEADVAKGTLYKYFPVKEALLQHYFHNELKQQKPQLMESLAQIPESAQRMKHFLALSADWSEKRRQYMPHYLHFRMNSASNSGSQQRSGIDKIFTELIRRGIERGEFRLDLPLESAVYYFSFLYFGALIRWINNDDTALNDEFSTVFDLFLNGYGASR